MWVVIPPFSISGKCRVDVNHTSYLGGILSIEKFGRTLVDSNGLLLVSAQSGRWLEGSVRLSIATASRMGDTFDSYLSCFSYNSRAI